MSTTPELAEKLRRIPMSWIWVGVFFVVVVVGRGLTPWDAIRVLLTNRGVNDEGAAVISYAAGYTLPLTLGFGIIAFLLLRGAHRGHSTPTQLGVAAVVLALCGFLAQAIGLGLLPNYAGMQLPGGPPFISLPVFVLSAYINSYSWPLMLCALVIGIACAVQAERWLQNLN